MRISRGAFAWKRKKGSEDRKAQLFSRFTKSHQRIPPM